MYAKWEWRMAWRHMRRARHETGRDMTRRSTSTQWHPPAHTHRTIEKSLVIKVLADVAVRGHKVRVERLPVQGESELVGCLWDNVLARWGSAGSRSRSSSCGRLLICLRLPLGVCWHGPVGGCVRRHVALWLGGVTMAGLKHFCSGSQSVLRRLQFGRF